MRNITLKQLRSVSAILRTGRIVTAASELNLTTPAVTSQLKLLEAELGASLFDRTRTGMRPTAAGWEVFRAASRVEDLLKECMERLDDLNGLRHGRITVGVVSTGKYFAPRLMAAFMDDHPHVDVGLTVGNRDAVAASLDAYEIDIAIMGRPPNEAGVEAVPFGRHPLVAIAAPDHHLSGQKRIPKRILARERFLIREGGSGTRAAFETFFEGLSLTGTSTVMEAGSNETIKQAVMAGLGIALISGDSIAAEIDDRRLVTLDAIGVPINRRWFLVRRTDRSLSAAARGFFDFVVDQGSSFLPSHGRFAKAERPAA